MQTKSLCAFLSVAVCWAASARAQTLEWVQQLESGENDYGYSVSTDELGNVYMAGATRGSLGGINSNPGTSDAFLAKYDASGSVQWIQQLGSSESESSSGVSTDGLGNVYITGQISEISGSAGDTDAFLAKYNDAGLLWTRQLGTSESDYGKGVSADGLGNIYISGGTKGSLGGINAGESDAFVAKYDASGMLEWTRQLGTGEDDRGYEVSADGLGNVYISGMTQGSLWGPNAGESDAFLAKYDASGNLQWTEQFGTSEFDFSAGVSADGFGNVCISGTTHGNLWGTNAGSQDAFLAKYDADGTLQWTQQFGTSEGTIAGAVSADWLGNVYVTGLTGGNLGSPNAGPADWADAFLAKYDASGTLQWIGQYGTYFFDEGTGVSADGSGNVYISGRQGFNPNGNWDEDAFLAKFVDLPVLQADFDADGDVDGNDFLLWQASFPLAGGATKSDGDYDNDGDVDGNDFLGWQAEFGSGGGSASGAVPEPAAALLLMVVVSAVACFQRCRRAERVSKLVSA